MESFTSVNLFPEEQKLIAERKKKMEDAYVKNGHDFIPLIKSSYDKMWEDATQRGKPNLWRNYQACNMNWNVWDSIYELFPERVGFDGESRPYFKLAEGIKVYFKMLDSRCRPKNIPTAHVKNRTQYNLFGENDTWLYIGWRIRQDKYWDGGLAGIYMVEMENHLQCKWIANLSILSGMIGKSVTTIIAPIIEDNGIIVLPKTGAADTAVNK